VQNEASVAVDKVKFLVPRISLTIIF